MSTLPSQLLLWSLLALGVVGYVHATRGDKP